MKLIDSYSFDEVEKAILDQNTELFSDILEKFGTDTLFKTSDCDGNTLLHIACSVGNVKAVIAALESGADLNVQNYCSGDTPLHLAIRAGSVVVITHLLNNGASVVEKNVLGNTAMHEAVISRSEKKVLKRILESYLTKNIVGKSSPLLNKEQKTPLGIALELGADAEVVNMLMLLENVEQKEGIIGVYVDVRSEHRASPRGN